MATIFWLFICALLGIDLAEDQVDKKSCHEQGGHVFLTQCQTERNGVVEVLNAPKNK